MKLSRRGFFGVAAGAAVGGPKAIKEVAANMSYPPYPTAAAPTNFSGWAETGAKAMMPDGYVAPMPNAMLRAFGLPKFLTDGWHQDARQREYIEPDLLAMKSMSTAAKRAIMHDRYMARSEEDFWQGRAMRMGDDTAQRLWEKLNGSVWGH